MRMDASHELFGSICVNLHLFGQQILLLAEYPAYRIEVQVPFQLALSKVAGELGLALPEVMRDVRLRRFSWRPRWIFQTAVCCFG